VPLVVDGVLGHVAVGFLDAAFPEVTGVAVVLVPGSAGPAAGMGTGAAHGWDDEIAPLECFDGRSGLDDLGQRLVADHQVIISRRRGPVFEGADLLVGAADADVEHLQHDLVRLGDPGIFLLDDFDLAGSREHCDCLHIHFREDRSGGTGAGSFFASEITPDPGGCLIPMIRQIFWAAMQTPLVKVGRRAEAWRPAPQSCRPRAV
jgi:hypothetical protein